MKVKRLLQAFYRGGRGVHVIVGFFLGLLIIALLSINYGSDNNRKRSKEARPVSAREKAKGKRILRSEVTRLAWDRGLSLDERVDLLRTIKHQLSEDEVVVLQAFLHSGLGADMADDHYAYLVNETLNLLHRQAPSLDEVQKIISGLVVDENMPVLVREYAVQHMRSVWEDGKQSSKLRGDVEADLWGLAESSDDRLSATALVTLHGLREEEAGRFHLSNERFLVMVPDVLSRSEVSPVMQMAALRVIAERELTSVRASVRLILEDENTSLAVRLHAIGAYGKIGAAAEAELLEPFKDEPLLSQAVALAQQNLTSNN